MTDTIPHVAHTLDTALAEWRTALGADHVHTEGETYAEFTDPYRPDGFTEGADAVAVLQPATTEEVQEVVRIAARHGIPLWTGSQGRNNGYGGSAPRTPGTVVVNLRRMDRILEVNEELAYVVVEPGVSFNQLYAHGKETGKKVIINTPDLGWGSVIGNTLEHGTGYTKYGDHASAMCGLEVVLADDSLVRTGYGAMTDNANWHLAPFAYGPRTDGLFTQSNLGIVTRMGMWVMPRPDTYADVWVKAPRDEDLEAMIDALRPLMLNGTIQNCPSIFNAAAPLGMAATREQLWPQGGMIPREALEAMALQIAGLMPWNLRLALYGDRVVVERHLALIREAFSVIEGVVVEALVMDGDEISDERTDLDQKGKVQAGIPDMYMLDALKWDGGDGGHLCLGTSGPLTGRDARAVVDLIREGSEERGFEYGCMFVVNPRSFIHLALQFFDKTRPERGEAAFALVRDMVVRTAERGYGEYRAHLDQMDLVAEQYGWGDQAHLRMVEKIKDALDPDGIFAPGKQGIWPRRLREGAARER